MHQMLYHIVSKNVKYKFWAFSFPFSKGTFLSLPDWWCKYIFACFFPSLFMQIFKIVEWRFFDGIVYCKTTIGTFEVWTYGGSIFEEFNAWFCTDYVFELCSTYASEAKLIVKSKEGNILINNKNQNRP